MYNKMCFQSPGLLRGFVTICGTAGPGAELWPSRDLRPADGRERKGLARGCFFVTFWRSSYSRGKPVVRVTGQKPKHCASDKFFSGHFSHQGCRPLKLETATIRMPLEFRASKELGF